MSSPGEDPDLTAGNFVTLAAIISAIIGAFIILLCGVIYWSAKCAQRSEEERANALIEKQHEMEEKVMAMIDTAQKHITEEEDAIVSQQIMESTMGPRSSVLPAMASMAPQNMASPSILPPVGSVMMGRPNVPPMASIINQSQSVSRPPFGSAPSVMMNRPSVAGPGMMTNRPSMFAGMNPPMGVTGMMNQPAMAGPGVMMNRPQMPNPRMMGSASMMNRPQFGGGILQAGPGQQRMPMNAHAHGKQSTMGGGSGQPEYQYEYYYGDAQAQAQAQDPGMQQQQHQQQQQQRMFPSPPPISTQHQRNPVQKPPKLTAIEAGTHYDYYGPQ